VKLGPSLGTCVTSFVTSDNIVWIYEWIDEIGSDLLQISKASASGFDPEAIYLGKVVISI